MYRDPPPPVMRPVSFSARRHRDGLLLPLHARPIGTAIPAPLPGQDRQVLAAGSTTSTPPPPPRFQLRHHWERRLQSRPPGMPGLTISMPPAPWIGDAAGWISTSPPLGTSTSIGGRLECRDRRAHPLLLIFSPDLTHPGFNGLMILVPSAGP